jgi:hypothetical protein
MADDYLTDDNFAYSESIEYGAMPAFIFFAAGKKGPDALLEECRAIAEAVQENILGKKGSGKEFGVVLGYAAGKLFGYIDIVFFNENEFVEEKVRGVLKSFGHAFVFSRFEPYSRLTHLCTGDGADLVKELGSLANGGAHEAVLEIIEDMGPAEDLDYNLALIYAEALNYVEEFDVSLPLLEKHEKKGKGDALWHTLIGTALIFHNRAGEASEHFRKRLEIGGEDEAIRLLLDTCLLIIKQEEEGTGKKKKK